jgi:hypothetical protein
MLGAINALTATIPTQTSLAFQFQILNGFVPFRSNWILKFLDMPKASTAEQGLVCPLPYQ